MTIIRNALDRDLKFVKIIADNAFERWIPTLGRRPGPMDIDYRYAIANHNVLVAQDNRGTVVGFCKFSATPFGSFVDVLAVMPDVQKRGYGRLLLGTLEEATFASGNLHVSLKTVATYFENIVFYNRCGYLVDSLGTYDGFPVYNLTKTIPPCS